LEAVGGEHEIPAVAHPLGVDPLLLAVAVA
jgi:hypothetical protein